MTVKLDAWANLNRTVASAIPPELGGAELGSMREATITGAPSSSSKSPAHSRSISI